MSALLQDNTYFLRLLLETAKKQALVLLENTTPPQATVLGEIAANLLTLPLTSALAERLVKRNKKLLRELSKKKNSVRTKQKLLSDNSVRIYNLLKSVEDNLLTLI